ncbi:MAG: hypothetical protein IT385_27300 [Deltaproteobacteria bacterium]|nr:hypothetical protein [Deltaproteobacteria bacterium]
MRKLIPVPAALAVLMPLGACLDQLEDAGEDDEADLATVEAPFTGDGCTSGAEGACDGVLTLPFNGTNYTLPYYRNHALGDPPSTIKRAVLVIHGANREPWKYFDAIVDSAAGAGKLGETIVLAPYFEKVPSHANGLCWTDPDWPIGGYTGTGCGNVSTFEVIDTILDRLLDRTRFPNLTRIVITGHSAGGQMTQRYAALGKRINSAIPAGVQIRYAPANPSSYMYLNGMRWIGGAWSYPIGCPAIYDFYGYGLMNRTATGTYHDDYAASVVRTLYPARDVHYIAGTADTDTSSEQFDDGCEASAQGANRFYRALVFGYHMDTWYPSHRHKLVLVANVGHSAPAIYTSAEGRRTLFAW